MNRMQIYRNQKSLTGKSANEFFRSPISGIVILVFALIFRVFDGYSQSSSRLGTEMKFEELPEGISQASVNCILQDHRGFMWLGTQDGLNRFDGLRFSVYKHHPNEDHALGNSTIYALLEDKQDQLWIGAERGGLNLFVKSKGSFIQFDYDFGNGVLLSETAIYDLLEDPAGKLWLGTGKGLISFDTENKVFLPSLPVQDIEKILNGALVWELFLDVDHNLWIGTDGVGVLRYNFKTGVCDHFQHVPGNPQSISGNIIRSIYEDHHRNIWIGTEGAGLNLFDPINKEFRTFKFDPNDPRGLADDDVWALMEDNDGRLMVGTDGGGLNILGPEYKFTRLMPEDRNPKSINDNVIRELYKDRQGNLWIGTFRGGVNVVYNYKEKFHLFNKGNGKGLSHNSVLAIEQSTKGGFWIGTDGGGLNFFDIDKNTYHWEKPPIKNQKSPQDDVVLSILEDSRGDLWVGTYGRGLKFLKNGGDKTVRYEHEADDITSLINNSVWVIFEDSNGDIWLGTNGGINLFDKAQNGFIRFEKEVFESRIDNSNSVRTIYEDRDKMLWIGVRGGVKMVDLKTKKLSTYYFNDYRRNYLVNNIFEDSQGNYWLGTYGGGLILFDPQTGPQKDLRMADGLPSDVIYGILEDEKGNLWLSTNNGLSRFNPHDLSFKNYSKDDGLQGNQFNLGAYYQDHKGRMWFGGVQGLNVFFPDSISDNKYIPPVLFTDFKVFNKSVSPGEKNSPLNTHISEAREIILTYSQSVFSFEFVGLNYIYPENNQYAFMLEGFEEDWNYVGNQPTATYTNLDPGEYVFRVKSSNNDGIWNEKGASIKVIITPPWWLTWWAYILYSLIVLTILWWSRRNIINRERLQINLKLEHMELTHMQEMDHMKSRFFANISHELRTPLTLILDPLKSMYQEEAHPKLQKQLKTMVRNGKRLLRLINQLLDLSKLEAGHMQLEASRKDMTKWLRRFVPTFSSYAEQHKITLETDFPHQPVDIYFDQDKLEQIITNLLSNALKFTLDGGKVKVEMHVVSQNAGDIGQEPSGNVEIVVSDNGVGIPPDRLPHVFDRFFQVDGAHHREQEGTGIGLALTKELVELHKGKIQVESQEQVGSKFIVTLKLGREHLDPTEIVESQGTELPERINMATGLDQIGAKQDEQDQSSFSGNGGKPVVLVVEDNNDLREYIREQLEGDYQVLEAGNGREGIKRALEIIPDLIISDVMMPEKDGIELCRTLKSDTKTSHVPIILLTAKADAEDKIKGLETGADDYIIKPFDTQILEVRINNLIRSRQLLVERYTNDKTLKLEPKEITVTPLDETFIKNALESIEQNMSNSEFGVEDFGKDVGLSRMQLYRKLKALTGQSPNEFIRTIRLKRAAQLIRQKQLTIAEITYEVGFNDLQYFRDCFKKLFGVNPSEYEKNKSLPQL